MPYMKGAYIESFTVKAEKEWREPWVHTDFDFETENAQQLPQPITILLNLEGETPIDFYGLKKNTYETSPLGKHQSHVFSNGDVAIFSWRQWHASGKPTSFPSGKNLRIHFMLSTREFDVNENGGYQLGHNNANNKKLRADIDKKLRAQKI